MLTEFAAERRASRYVYGELRLRTRPKWTRGYYLCFCSCGTFHIASGNSLLRGKVKSCGCLHREVVAKLKWKHGHRVNTSRTYNSWRGMKDRCLQPTHRFYKHYGGRGVSVCPQWLEFSFFLHDMGERPIGKTLDRIDVDRGYFPGNCRWADSKTQARNTRWRKSRGETHE